MDDSTRYELERLRREYDAKIMRLEADHQLERTATHARLDSLERETARVRDQTRNQDDQLTNLVEMAQKMQADQHRAITPQNLRNWIIGLASLIGAIMLILSTINSYNQNQVIRHEEKRWIQEQRATQNAK